ncbi:hypothetical protein D3C72_1268040 [compost metagenome]
MQPANVGVVPVGQQLIEHAQHGGEADPGGEQHHGRAGVGLQEEIAGRRHQRHLITDLQLVVQQVGYLAIGLALDADAVVTAVGCIGEGVLADLLILQLRVVELDAEVLTRLEVQHGLAIAGGQHEGGDEFALHPLLLDEEGAGALPATGLGRLLLIDLALAADEDVGQHPVGLAPGIQHLLGDRTTTQFFERGQEMTTYNVILFRLDHEARVLVGDALHRAGQGTQIVDVLGVRRDGVEQCQRLATTALVRQVEDILQLGVVAEHALIEMLGEGRPRRFEQGNGTFDDGDGGLI